MTDSLSSKDIGNKFVGSKEAHKKTLWKIYVISFPVSIVCIVFKDY